MCSKRTTQRLASALLLATLVTCLGYVVSSSLAEPAPRRLRAAAAGQPATQEPTKTPRNIYAVLFKMSVGFTEGEEIPGMAEHIRFIKAANADGTVPIAGPIFNDDEKAKLAGALYLIRAASLEEARSIAQKEPLVQHKTVKIESIWPFLAGVGADRLD